ncbi:hypothetical protein B0H21DRAFT_20898 [Amylocystis lapponica]|nr:hypothetical protein B0H21DRAFT_20898 [Amylocystis lapponica]
MSDTLSNPLAFNITYPTAVHTSLNSSASFARFDPSGRFVAAGRNDGSAIIWNLDTKAPVRWLEGHVKDRQRFALTRRCSQPHSTLATVRFSWSSSAVERRILSIFAKSTKVVSSSVKFKRTATRSRR